MSLARPAAAWRTSLSHPSLNGGLRLWLSDEGSLTARLRTHSRCFEVRVLRQAVLPPLRDERAALGLGVREHARVREVVLMADGVPRVFAHSVLALGDARGPWCSLAGMGTRSLGALLFADRRIRRSPLAFRRLDARHPLYRAAIRAAGIRAESAPFLWARRSVFTRSGKSLMVCEVFLPEVFAL
ncbi:MAG: chorismate lyase [Sterolibacterium sp.]|nr:chorismate lyase [Sterolibacterium sp.]